MTNSNVILLTASIRPTQLSRLAIADPAVRLGEYRRSVEFWRRQDLGPVVLADNSGARLDELFPGLIRDDQLIEVPPGLTEVRGGKGAEEGRIVDHSVPIIMDRFPQATQITKVTGRLRVQNAKSALRLVTLPAASWIRCQVANDLSHVDSRCLQFSLDVFEKYIRGAGGLVDESNQVFLEHVLLSRFVKGFNDGSLTWLRMKHPLIYRGRSGTLGTAYGWKREIVTGIARKLEMKSRFGYL